jgi:hypothetical protein
MAVRIVWKLAKKTENSHCVKIHRIDFGCPLGIDMSSGKIYKK